MKRELPYDISYSRLKCWRKFENFALYVSIGCSLAVQTLQQLDGNCIIGFVQVLSFISLIMYGILFVVVEIFLQPRVATERQKGFLDNSLGTKLLLNNTVGYYDNDNIPVGAKKLLVNTFENCFFTYSIMKKMLNKIVLCNIGLFLVLLFFAYYGYKDNLIAMTLLQIFFSTIFFRRLMYHISFCLKLKEIQDLLIYLFSSKSVSKKKLEDNGYYYTLMYETALAYNKAPNSDKIYEKYKDELNEQWAMMKKRYGI